jgi:uncharacterized protein YbjT (DUF2867 family)
MARVLVTGGTGMLGRQLVPRLIERGHEVTALSRRPDARLPARASWRRGDVLNHDSVRSAITGMDVVVHAASSPTHKSRRTEVDGTRNFVTAMQGTDAHLVYVSIVGVDRHRFPYYKAKWAAEQVVEASARAWTIQRATQFFDLMELFLGHRVFIATRNLRFQPVATLEVADRLADLVETGPSGRVPDFGGPEAVPIRQIEVIRRRHTGRRAWLVPIPAVGFLRDFDDGRHLCPDQRAGKLTWEQWLQSRA